VVVTLANLPATGDQMEPLALINTRVVSPDPRNLPSVAPLIQQPGSEAFSRSSFYQRIAIRTARALAG